MQVEGEIEEDCNLGAVGDAVNSASTPHKDQSPPGVSLVLYAELDKASAKKAVKALGSVKGVDAEGSTADAEKGEISAKIAGGEKVTVADITTALKDAGIEAGTGK